MIYQISSGQGPAECELGVARFLEYLQKNYEVTVHDFFEGYNADTYRSVRFSSPAYLSCFVGSVQCVWQSTYSSGHKRKNGFLISANVLSPQLRTSMKNRLLLKHSEAAATVVRMSTKLRLA